LAHCPNIPTLRKALNSLPKDLDETYARILSNIPEEYSDYALGQLHWLTHSLRPLRLDELAEVFAIRIEGHPWFDQVARFPEKRDLLSICSSLVSVEDVNQVDTEGQNEEVAKEDSNFWTYAGSSIEASDGDSPIVRLAHLSVREYLVSERIRNSSANKFAIQYKRSHEYVSATCLSYLFNFDQKDSLRACHTKEGEEGLYQIDRQHMIEYPLSTYASEYWTQHAQILGTDLGRVQDLSLELLRPDGNAFLNWLRLCNGGVFIGTDGSICDGPRPPYIDEDGEAGVGPLHMMVNEYGVDEIVPHLLDRGEDANAKTFLGFTALMLATLLGHEANVRRLIQHDATVNDIGPEGTALMVASSNGHIKIVCLLLEHGADVNIVYKGPTALMKASLRGYTTAVRLVLDYGADVNVICEGLTALMEASLGGYTAVVRLLLDHGADVNVACEGATALMIASSNGHVAIVRLLLEYGADVNAVCEGATALMEASSWDYTEVVNLLHEHGADVNVVSHCDSRTALSEAISQHGDDAKIQL